MQYALAYIFLVLAYLNLSIYCCCYDIIIKNTKSTNTNPKDLFPISYHICTLHT